MKLEVFLNQNKVNSLKEFIELENRYYNGSKPTVFVIQTGVESDSEFLEEIKEADMKLADLDKTAKNWYYRGGPLEAYMDNEKKEVYTKLAEQWISQGKGTERNLTFQFENGLWYETFSSALEEVIEEYKKQETNEGRVRNFLILLFFRIDFYFPELFKNTRILSKFPKFVYTGVCNHNEYFFLKLLSLCGCDVYGLHPKKTLSLSESEISASVQLVKKSQELTCKIPPFDIEKIRSERAVSTTPSDRSSSTVGNANQTNSGIQIEHPNRIRSVAETATQASTGVNIEHPTRIRSVAEITTQVSAGVNIEHPTRIRSVAETATQVSAGVNIEEPTRSTVKQQRQTTPFSLVVNNEKRKMSDEELVQLASNVVVRIILFNNENEPFASCSGVLISNEGYILTNLHLVGGAAYYGIRLENEEEIQYTSDFIKYHTNHDLALLRISPVKRKTLSMYSGKKLVRGQSVTVIGASLGFYDKIFDGCISEFYEENDLSLFQFTAELSEENSGGVIINSYGELIGIIVATYNNGQNLAVDYKTILSFLRGFI